MSDDGIFLRNSWYVAAWNHELIDGRKLARTILERPVVIYRGTSGRVVALDASADDCVHLGAGEEHDRRDVDVREQDDDRRQVAVIPIAERG